jgi:hypothetical protein
LVVIVSVTWRAADPGQSSSSAGDGAPEQIVDQQACINEECRFGERWFARQDADLFAAPPTVLGTSFSSLRKDGLVKIGSAVTTIRAIRLEQRRDGIVQGAMEHAPQLRPGQVISIYTMEEGGCPRSWIGGALIVICGQIKEMRPQVWETWVQVRTEKGTIGWFKTSTNLSSETGLASQTQLNDELAGAISSELPLSAKLAKIDSLLSEGADLNGNGNKHGTDPSDAVTMTRDVELLNTLMKKGLKVHNDGKDGHCTAHWMYQGVALEPGGDAMLDALLSEGMEVKCLTPGNGSRAMLPAFLSWGLGGSDYSVDRAIRVAEVLVKHGVDINQRDYDGKSIFDRIEQHIPENPELVRLQVALRSLTGQVATEGN